MKKLRLLIPIILIITVITAILILTSLYVFAESTPISSTKPQSYENCVDAHGNTLDPVFVNNVYWELTGSGLKMPVGYENSFLLFNTPLENNKIEATILVNDLTYGDNNHRNGIVFALTDHDSDLSFNYLGDDVSYYWAFINDWGFVEVIEMGAYQSWTWLSNKSANLSDFGIDITKGVTLSAEWDKEGHIKIYSNDILIFDLVDSTPLTGEYYGLLVNKYGNFDPNYGTYDAPVTSFVAGRELLWDSSDIQISGICGYNLTWTLDFALGELTISGIGDMYDYGYSDAPWYSNRDSIQNLIINSSVSSISDYAFYDCSKLKTIMLGNGVTSIGSGAFAYCDSLTNVHITDISSWCAVDFSDYYSNPLCYADNFYLNNTLVTTLVIPNDVKSIGNYAFYDCDGLTRVTIGNGVTSIGGGAFSGCSNLTSINIPDSVTRIGERAFAGCTSLANIVIPDSVTSIGYDTFSGCAALERVTIGKKVSSIGAWAFWGCTSLTSVNIPDSVTSIGMNAFYACGNLTSITIPDSVTSVGNWAFLLCAKLDSVYITDISSWCAIDFPNFYSNPLSYADNLYLNNNLVTDLVIPEGVTSIGSYAFGGYGSLESVIIPSSVTSIGSSAFEGCTSLSTVYFDGKKAKWNKITISDHNEDLTSAEIIFLVITYGDAGGDGEIGTDDVILLRQYITSFNYDTSTSLVIVDAGADANGDGKINISDIILLRQYITNYDYETGSSSVVLGPQQ